jgi:putative restriction endonuclease
MPLIWSGVARGSDQGHVRSLAPMSYPPRMRYWWVNQNQTYRHEIDGGYLWSPTRKSNQQRNAFYESMREVAPGDLIFSFCDTRIAAIGIASSFCYESPKPTEFGATGTNWGATGWKVDVRFQVLSNRIRPKDHIDSLRALLPPKYSPLRSNGDGIQSVYLTEIPQPFGRALLSLVGHEASSVRDAASAVAATERVLNLKEQTIEEWERRVEAEIQQNRSLKETERAALVQARRGQGLFRINVQRIESRCRITKVDRPEHLIASHTKPWRDSNNEERLDPENGLLLTPTIDHLFDKGFISFESSGDLIISPVAHEESLTRMGIAVSAKTNVGTFTEGQRQFLDYHRDNVLKMSNIRRDSNG